MNESISAIRQAISRDDYQGALGLWNRLAFELRKALDRGEVASEQMHQIEELFKWSSVALKSARAHLQSRWNSAHSAAAYLAHQSTAGTFGPSV
jgi:hypothetical protein